MGVLWLVLLPLTPWGLVRPVTTTLMSGVTVQVPKTSSYGARDLERLLSEAHDIRHVVVSYGWYRSVYRVYPDTLAISITGPWSLERLRYPLGQRIEQALRIETFLPSTLVSNDIVIERVQGWITSDGEWSTFDQIITIRNVSRQPMSRFTLPLPSANWELWSYEGQPIDHVYEPEGLPVLLPDGLAPSQEFTLLLSRRTPVIQAGPHALFEVLVLQPAGVPVEVQVRGKETASKYTFQREQNGHWRVLIEERQGDK